MTEAKRIIHPSMRLVDFKYAKKYSIIYADPPWHYNNQNVNGSAIKHYQTLTDRDIQHLNIKGIAADNAALFLWVTFPKLVEGIATLRAWGFTYKTVAFVWVKLNSFKNTLFTGLGFYTRSNCEICLLGLRGSLPRQSKSVHSVIMAKREKEHSKKPEVTRNKIIDLFGCLPRIELFATQDSPGWDVTGLDYDGLDIRTFIDNKINSLE